MSDIVADATTSRDHRIMKRRFAAAMAIASLFVGSDALFAQEHPADWPDWAYGFLEPMSPDSLVAPACPANANPRSCSRVGQAVPDDGVLLTLPGTSRSFTRTAANNQWGPADWFPGDHPEMPEIVATGRKEAGIRPCSLCHFANGRGKMENGHVAGLSKEYFLAQLEAFANGERYSADPRKANTNEMARIAHALTETEKQQVAEYYSSIRFRSMMRVVESDSAPQVSLTLNNLMLPIEGAPPMPLGQRIIEVPEFPNLTEKMRYPRGTFIAYVPIGSVAKGQNLVTTGGEKTIPCGTCHGPQLQGFGDAPSIVGRTASYAMRQLWDVKQGARKSPLMTAVVADLSAEDMLNIVAYLATRTP